MNRYFRLNNESELLFDNKNQEGVLYNFLIKKMFLIKKSVYEVLEMLEKDLAINEVAKNTEFSIENILELTNYLLNKGFGDYYSSKVYIEKLREPDPLAAKSLWRDSNIKSVSLYLSGGCSLGCHHCRTEDFLLSNPCETCAMPLGMSRQDMSLEMIEKYIIYSSKLGVEEVVLKIGNSHDQEERILHAIKACYHAGITRSIISTGAGLNQQILREMSRYHIKLRINYSISIKEGRNTRSDFFSNIKEQIESANFYGIIPSINLISPIEMIYKDFITAIKNEPIFHQKGKI
ncbi:MAG: hypothetical protein PQJ46_01695, partial [Spirochaetales bacterium]|nr:hypothetical protein [Spirochaetales bacterium]